MRPVRRVRFRVETAGHQHEDDATLAGAAALGLDLTAITEQLQLDGVAAFARSYAELLHSLDQKRRDPGVSS